MTDADTVRMHAAQGLTRAVHPDAKEHFRAILEAIDADNPPELVACDSCGTLAHPDRLDGHDCH